MNIKYLFSNKVLSTVGDIIDDVIIILLSYMMLLNCCKRYLLYIYWDWNFSASKHLAKYSYADFWHIYWSPWRSLSFSWSFTSNLIKPSEDYNFLFCSVFSALIISLCSTLEICPVDSSLSAFLHWRVSSGNMLVFQEKGNSGEFWVMEVPRMTLWLMKVGSW